VIHELKIKPEYFAAVVSGDKTFEIRNNADRNFQVGDTLLLWGWDGGFTGQTVERVVSYITDFEQKPGYVVLGLANKREQELAEQLADATRQCGVMAELLRKARTNVDQVRRWGRFDHDEGCGAEAALLLARIDVALAGKEASRIITEGQEIELVTVLQSIVNGFSDDPAHDAAALLKRITGEVPWTGDSFQIPPRQGGEPCDSASPSSSKA